MMFEENETAGANSFQVRRPAKGEVIQIPTRSKVKGSNVLPSFSKDVNPDGPREEKEKGHGNV